jgi:membrane protein DedA with SNARE-associated domain
MPTSILSQCAYLAIGVGTYLEGEAVLLSAGALAHAGVLSLPLVVLVAALGSFAWGQTWFRLGRVSGQGLIARRPAWQAQAARVERWLSRSGLWVLLFGRFCVGMGTVLPVMIGVSGYAWRRFVLLDAIGALIWATIFACAGFGGAAALHGVFGRSLAWPSLAIAAASLALCSWLVIELFAAGARRRAARDTDPQA